MKKLVLVAVFLLGFSVMGVAQDAPLVEIFGGYSLVMVDVEDTVYVPEEADLDLNLNGWNAQVAFNGNKWLGAVADFGGYYGSIEGPDGEGEDANVRVHSIMFGPRVALYRGKVTPFVQLLAGYAKIKADVDGEEVFGENNFAMAFGGGIDYNLTNMIAIRPVQLDYFTTKAGLTGDFADHLRYSAGVVIKLGSR